MGLFNRKPKVVSEIEGGAWGWLVQQGIDVDTLCKDVRCVKRKGKLEDGKPVTFLRIFRLSGATSKGVEITGWETFDQHPDLILFEGYLTDYSNEAHLQRKKA